MALSKHVEKLDKYYERLESGKAKKIKPSHVDKIIQKLKVKHAELQQEIQDSQKASKKDRLERKLSIVTEQITRAEWMLAQITTPAQS